MDIYDDFERFDKSNKIDPTAIIHESVTLGRNNVIGAYCVIGSNGEIRGKDQAKFRGRVEIGSGNVISEHVTIQRPYDKKATVIGDENIIMAHAHIGHDAKIGNKTEICTGSIIGGYAVISDGAKIKLGSTIRNRKTIGKNALVGMGSVVVKDVLPDQVVKGNPSR
jgi:UDP-N-acetylglucosamine acyltransferase